MNHLSNTELRLELAAAESIRPQTIRAVVLKRNKVRAVTKELIKRGSF